MGEEFKNISREEVLEMVDTFPIKPLRRNVIVTINTDEFTGDTFETSETGFSESQFVVAKGDFVEDKVQLGDKVLIDLKSMVNRDGRLEIMPIEVGDYTFTMISDNLLKAIDNR